MAGREPLYLVCGLMSDGTVWKAQHTPLATRFELRILNFPDHDSIPGMAASVLDMLPRRFSLAGHSMGGRVALEIYRTAGDRVSRLALLDTGIYPAHEKEPEIHQRLIDLAREHGMAAMAKEWIASIVHPDRLDDAELVDALSAMAQRHTPQQLAGQLKALLERPDMRDVLPTIDCPTLVCCGRQDEWASVGQHQDMAAVIRRANLAIVEYCGHMTTMERPAQLNRLLLEWSGRSA